MIPARFDYEVAESVEQALAALAADPEAKLIAGGHSLVPALKLRIARPSKLIDIGRLADLSYVRDAGDQVAIGALTRHKDVHGAALLHEHCPVVSKTAGMIGDPQVRHRGTIGGSLAHGDPASDLPAVILALDAEVVIRGAAGERVVPASRFFTGVFQTAVGAGEMLTEIRVPKLAAGTRAAYLKANRRAQDWATVGVAVVVRAGSGGVESAGIGLVNMGGTPLRAQAAEQALAGGASAAEAAELLAQGAEPPSDHAGSAEYRRHLVSVLGRRALEQAMA